MELSNLHFLHHLFILELDIVFSIRKSKKNLASYLITLFISHMHENIHKKLTLNFNNYNFNVNVNRRYMEFKLDNKVMAHLKPKKFSKKFLNKLTSRKNKPYKFKQQFEMNAYE